MTKEEEKKSQRDLVFENLEKTYGKDFIQNADKLEARRVLSTGHKELDEAIGVNGIPLGIIVELYGPEASGKGVLSMHICREAQKNGMSCLWVDAENQCNKEWMIINGVDVEKMHVMIPVGRSAEEILGAVHDLVSVGAYNIVVIDSLAALTPQIEMDKPMGETQMGRMGAIMSIALKKITPVASKNDCTIIFINQIREKVGIMFGNPETTPGGRALGHYASLRIRIQKTGEKIEREKEQIGVKSQVKIMKNRFAMPFKEAIIPIYYQAYNPTPLDKFYDLARKYNCIRKRTGNYYFAKYVSENIEDLITILYNNHMLKELVADIKEKAYKKQEQIADLDVLKLMSSIENDEFTFEAFNK